MSRRVPDCIAVALLVSTAASAWAVEPPLTTVRVASGLTRPVFVTSPPGDRTRLFIVEQRSGTTGRIQILNLQTGALDTTRPFATVSGLATGNEQGLLGLAFDPNYASNGYFYVYYTASNFSIHIDRFTVSSDPNVADQSSQTPVLSFPHPNNTNHNGGWIAFGPADGYLYAAVGDGGSGNDPPGNAQNLLQYLGKLLRLDVNGDDFPADPAKNYAIPPSNPFFGATFARQEIWAYGLRNPWRNAFDRQTHDLWIADVGQGAWEEVDFQPAATTTALNYGWRCMEGKHCTGLSGCTCNDPNLVVPIYEYDHTGGNCSLTGGYIYRGSKICGLSGTYFFADYCTARIWSLRYNGTTVTDFQERTSQLGGGGGFPITSITSFGEDDAGEVYILSQGGNIYRIIQAGPQQGDLNNDGAVNFGDINAFVQALADPAGYQTQFGFPPERAGDLNCDGVADFGDINPFVALLAGS